MTIVHFPYADYFCTHKSITIKNIQYEEKKSNSSCLVSSYAYGMSTDKGRGNTNQLLRYRIATSRLEAFILPR